MDVGQFLIGLIGYGIALTLLYGMVCVLMGWHGNKQDGDAAFGLGTGSFVLVILTRFVLSFF